MKFSTLFLHLTIAISFIPFTSLAQPGSNPSVKPIIHTVRSGDTFYSLLKKNGFNQDQKNTVVAALKDLELWDLSTKTKFWRINEGSRVTLKFFHPVEDMSLNLIREGKTARVDYKKEDYKVQVISKTGKVHGSIIASIMKEVPSRNVAYRFLDAYRFDYNLTRVLQRNAHFSLTVEKKFLGDQFIRFGEILKTEVEVKGNIDRRYFIRTGLGGGFVSMNDLQEDRPLYAPVNYVKISSEYKRRRFHPIKKRRIAHLGVDFELPEGAPIFTAGQGTVIRKGKNRAAGRYVVVRHKDGLESYYNHMSEIDPAIKVGTHLKNGQRVGAIGCTGYCTKPHLHFAVKKRGRFVNPIDYLKSFSFTNKQPVVNQVERLRKVAQAGS
tara:strand:- start:249781 stop:250923 length:1143 start_codon:yes stop_codon:yes gene_type:complete